MKLSLFDYKLPDKLIAQKPATPRDSARLLIYNKNTKKVTHDIFSHLTNYLRKGDLLIFNNSKVIPARLLGNKHSGGKAEVLLLEEKAGGSWEVLLGLRNPQVGLKLLFKAGLEAEVISKTEGKTWLIRFNFKGQKFYNILGKIGQVPLPPYIKSRSSQNLLQKQYQTIYARKIGSAAAPTAGLHFTPRLMKKIENTGCEVAYATLHVGLGTFEPVNTEKIEDFEIHSEFISIEQKVIKKIIKAKQEQRRVIAVGTTTVRTIESAFSQEGLKTNHAFQQKTNIFIYPGYKFKIIDGIITNFHLPKSSLLMLVSAFMGRSNALKIYQQAIKLKYKFFSFGDAMFIK